MLTGERGHYALANGEDPLPYLGIMNAMAGNGGLLPEQVWDDVAVPERRLLPGRPSGSAMPLVWAHAEFIKLAASHARGQAIDCPAAVVRRYSGQRPQAMIWVWTVGARIGQLAAGRSLLILLPQPAHVRLGFDGWTDIVDRPTRPQGLGLHGITLGPELFRAHVRLDFTWQWQSSGWRGENFSIELQS